MRTCKYRIFIDNSDAVWRPKRQQEHAAQWSRFVDLCRSLDKDGFTYTTTVRSDDRGHIRLLITGTAKRAARSKPKTRKRYTMPAILTPTQCAKRVAEAKAIVLAGKIIRPHRMTWYDHDKRRQSDDRKIGRLIAKAKARGESTVDLTEVYGFNARHSVGALIAERKQKHYTYPAREVIDDTQERLSALADYKFWRELEALSGQRQKFKPGLTEADALNDDEAIAA